MTAVDDGIAVVDGRFADVMSLCLQCRACETACPSLVPFGSVMEASRAEVEAQIPTGGSRLRRFVVTGVLRSRLLLALATVGAALLQRIGLLRWVPGVGKQASGLRHLKLGRVSLAGRSWGHPEGKVAALLTGCVADVWFTNVHQATIEILQAAGYRVETPKTQTCCGALASHGGFADESAAMAVVNIEAFAGADVVVTDVAGCGAHLATYGRYGGQDVAAKTRDINSVVAQAIEDGALPTFPNTGIRVGIQDPCHLEHGLRAHTVVDTVVAAAGYTPVPIDRGGLCCGAAGLYQVDHPDMAHELGVKKAATAEASGASIIASANAGCEMQLRRHLNDGIKVVHPVELYAERLRDQAPIAEPPGP
jgi:glycolate oxidase iron-sulfur subunit